MFKKRRQEWQELKGLESFRALNFMVLESVRALRLRMVTTCPPNPLQRVLSSHNYFPYLRLLEQYSPKSYLQTSKVLILTLIPNYMRLRMVTIYHTP